jgi:MinD-like ATPase involved in chromosome partitioning or flagellar assembly
MKQLSSPELPQETEPSDLSTAFIFTEGAPYSTALLARISALLKKQKGKHVAYLTGENSEKFDRYLRGLTVMEDIVDGFSVSAALSSLEDIREKPLQVKQLITLFETLEKEYDHLLYPAGNQIGACALNSANLSSRIIFVVKPTRKSILEVQSYLSILAKSETEITFGVIVDTSDRELSEKQSMLLQEIAKVRFNYKIEALGCFDLEYIHLFDEHDVSKWLDMTFFSLGTGDKTCSGSMRDVFR